MNLSASAVARGLACPASLVLPQQDYRTEYADAGTERHEEQEEAIERGDLSSLPDDVRALIVPGAKMATELSFAYDPVNDTARALGKVTNHDYSPFRLSPFDIPGTIDLLVVGGGRAVVVDYKGFEEVDEAYDNDQLATYALMVSRTWGYDAVTAAIVYLVAFRRPSIATLSAGDLVFHRDRLRQLQLDAASARRDPAPFLSAGSHCKYCPAFLSCPEQSRLRNEVKSTTLDMQLAERMPLSSDVDAAEVYELWGRIKMLSQRIGAALHARAAERPIPLPDGRVFGPRPVKGHDELDGNITYEVVRAKYGQGIADAAVERNATKKQLKAALGFAVGKGKLAAAEREVIDLVREKGGVTNTPKMKIEEHIPQRLLKAVP